ncbi:uncharacterized protein LOC141907611 [Tubulanus polymorphus]|uniref:uncharacterized protein LOC141907611 n=1 Tax=Tubulanus polymorphus TaxID=672921 RepID=UPI003DA42581
MFVTIVLVTISTNVYASGFVKVGDPPQDIGDEGRLQANLMYNVTFPADGTVYGWEFYVKRVAPCRTWITIWRKSDVSELNVTLVAKTRLQYADQGVKTLLYNSVDRIQVKAGDFLGIGHKIPDGKNEGHCISNKRYHTNPCTHVVNTGNFGVYSKSIGWTTTVSQNEFGCRQYSIAALYIPSDDYRSPALYTEYEYTTASNDVIESAAGHSLLTCAAWCARSQLCMSYQHFDAQKICQLINRKTPRAQRASSDSRWKAYGLN